LLAADMGHWSPAMSSTDGSDAPRGWTRGAHGDPSKPRFPNARLIEAARKARHVLDPPETTSPEQVTRSEFRGRIIGH